jgi:hypothetical protein
MESEAEPKSGRPHGSGTMENWHNGQDDINAVILCSIDDFWSLEFRQILQWLHGHFSINWFEACESTFAVLKRVFKIGIFQRGETHALILYICGDSPDEASIFQCRTKLDWYHRGSAER